MRILEGSLEEKEENENLNRGGLYRTFAVKRVLHLLTRLKVHGTQKYPEKIRNSRFLKTKRFCGIREHDLLAKEKGKGRSVTTRNLIRKL